MLCPKWTWDTTVRQTGHAARALAQARTSGAPQGPGSLEAVGVGEQTEGRAGSGCSRVSYELQLTPPRLHSGTAAGRTGP